MADASCGPSNALSSFQKHTAVDRTLQQDRLTGRHTPAQDFRTAPGPNAGALDQEFEAFMAGHAAPPPQWSPRPAQFQAQNGAPAWASDFQRSGPAVMEGNAASQSSLMAHAMHLQRNPQSAQTAPLAPGWASDFQRLNLASPQPAPNTAFAPPMPMGGMYLQRNPPQGMGWGGPGFPQRPGFGAMNGMPMSESAQGKQRAQDAVPQFDDASFDHAFEQAQRDAMEGVQESDSALNDEGRDALLQEFQEEIRLLDLQNKKRLALAKERGDVGSEMGQDSLPGFDLEMADENISTQRGEQIEPRGIIGGPSDYNEQLRLLKLHNEKQLAEAGHNTVREGLSTQRGEESLMQKNQRLMSEQPLFSSLGQHTPQEPIFQEQQPEQQTEEQQQQQQNQHDADEMAETAGRLLDRVSDNTSSKFQNSQFLELMRRLRDREVRVEGDKMVDVSATQSSHSPLPTTSTSTSAPSTSAQHQSAKFSQIPPVDGGMILDHADFDFDMPSYLDGEFDKFPFEEFLWGGPFEEFPKQRMDA